MDNKPETRALFRDVQGVFIFLSLRQNRFFALSPRREFDFRAQLGKSPTPCGECIISATDSIEVVETGRVESVAQVDSSFEERASACGIRDLFAGARIRWSMKRRVSRADLEGIRDNLQEIRKAPPSLASPLPAMRLTNRVFDAVSRIVSPEDDCLALASAKVEFLLRMGIEAHCIIGVRRNPFAAHAWAQHSEFVIGEDSDTIRNYLPIAAL